MYSLNIVIIIITLLMVVCVLATKYLTKFGVPILILFVGVGMLLGSEGLLGVYFDNPYLAREIGNISLCFISFGSGLSLRLKSSKKILLSGILLSALGVLLTAVFVGVFAYLITGMTLIFGFLLGVIISSTDAASFFSISRAQKIEPEENISHILELESGSNDTMAYMLTLMMIGIIVNPRDGTYSHFVNFIWQLGFGSVFGVVMGWITVQMLNRIHHSIESMYLILTVSLMMLAYSLSEWVGGNGFLTVYILGIIIGNSSFVRKTRVTRFFDGQSWLAQIALFITLGLQVFPSKLFSVSIDAIIISVGLLIVVRPLIVLSVLSLIKIPFKHQLFISFVGFRGASSIVFATYLITAGIPVAEEIFEIVFFVVLLSITIQGLALKPLAHFLGVVKERDENFQMQNAIHYADEISDMPMLGVYVPVDSPAVGNIISELELPEEIRIIAIRQVDGFTTPKGSTVIGAGDRMLITSINEDIIKHVCEKFKFEV